MFLAHIFGGFYLYSVRVKFFRDRCLYYFFIKIYFFFSQQTVLGPYRHTYYRRTTMQPYNLRPRVGGRANKQYFNSSQNMRVIACSCAAKTVKDAATQTETIMTYAVSTQMPDKSPFQYLVQSVFPSQDTVHIQVRTPPRWSSPTAIDSNSPCY